MLMDTLIQLLYDFLMRTSIHLSDFEQPHSIWSGLLVCFSSYMFRYNFLGHCTEYNSLGAAIQEHFSLKCSDVKPPCNTSYLSTEAYLCKWFS